MKIGVLGSGQLGRMLALSAYPLGHEMLFLASSAKGTNFLIGEAGIFTPLSDICGIFLIMNYEL